MSVSLQRCRRRATPGRRSAAGFTLTELMIVVAIIGVRAAIAVPIYRLYVVRAKVTEGINMLAAKKTDIATFYASKGRLPKNFEELDLGAANGTAYGGDAGGFRDVVGHPSDMWKRVEYQPHAGGYALVVRSFRKPQWDNVEIALHYQIKASDGSVQFRCTVNEHVKRYRFVPGTCRHGGVDEWDW